MNVFDPTIQAPPAALCLASEQEESIGCLCADQSGGDSVAAGSKNQCARENS